MWGVAPVRIATHRKLRPLFTFSAASDLRLSLLPCVTLVSRWLAIPYATGMAMESPNSTPGFFLSRTSTALLTMLQRAGLPAFTDLGSSTVLASTCAAASHTGPRLRHRCRGGCELLAGDCWIV